jgi:hypothetical protein
MEGMEFIYNEYKLFHLPKIFFYKVDFDSHMIYSRCMDIASISRIEFDINR